VFLRKDEVSWLGWLGVVWPQGKVVRLEGGVGRQQARGGTWWRWWRWWRGRVVVNKVVCWTEVRLGRAGEVRGLASSSSTVD